MTAIDAARTEPPNRAVATWLRPFQISAASLEGLHGSQKLLQVGLGLTLLSISTNRYEALGIRECTAAQSVLRDVCQLNLHK